MVSGFQISGLHLIKPARKHSEEVLKKLGWRIVARSARHTYGTPASAKFPSRRVDSGSVYRLLNSPELKWCTAVRPTI